MTKRKSNPFIKILIAMLVIIVVMLVFTFSSFGVDSNSVIDGYNSSRVYATKTKAMQASIDVFKDAVDTVAAFNEAKENGEAVSFGEFPAYGTLLTDEEYEAFAASLIIQKGSGANNYTGTASPDLDIACNANMSTSGNGGAISWFTHDGKKGIYGEYGGGDFSLCYARAAQCAGFANFVFEQVSGLNKPLSDVGIVSSEAKSAVCRFTSTSDTVGINPLSTAEECRAFFKNVVPGTYVRVAKYHSYIILGADEKEVVFIDANDDHECGILLHRFTWETFASWNALSGTSGHGISFVISPNGYLPAGCYDKKIGQIDCNNEQIDNLKGRTS